MKITAHVVIVPSFALLLRSSGRRYEIARPSLWLRWRQSKVVSPNDFLSDYPLNFTSFVCLDSTISESHCLTSVFLFGESSRFLCSEALGLRLMARGAFALALPA
jgi:hypothetical protein